MSETAVKKRRPRVLVIVAHPDDAEFICGGTLARWSREGYQISYCICTDGNHGSHDEQMTPQLLAEIRQREQMAAARVFGTDDVHFLHFVDAELEPTIELRKAITRIIRKVRPHIVVCLDPTMFWSGEGYINHPDHRASGEAALAAVMPSADTRLIFPELLVENLQPHKVSHIYLAATNSPNVWMPLTEEDLELKVRAIRAHASQIGDWPVEERMREWARANAEEARKHGVTCEYAESFRVVKLRDLDEALGAEEV